MSPSLVPLKMALVPLVAAALMLAGCSTVAELDGRPDPHPAAVLPSMQYAMTADTQVRAMNFRVEPGLSENQRRALDQVAAHAAWTADQPVDVQIVTSGDPAGIAAGRTMAAYLYAHDVADKDLTLKSSQDQAPDIVTVNLIFYRNHHQVCNQTWQNLAATGGNETYENFGCAVTADLAAQVADPRDLDRPQAATPADITRESVVLDKYRKGAVTSSATDEAAKGTISDAVH